MTATGPVGPPLWLEPCLWGDEPPEDSCFDVGPELEREPAIEDVIVIGGLL